MFAAISGIDCQSVALTCSSRKPTDTIPMTSLAAPKIGTFARTDRPSVPCSIPTHDWPWSAGEGSVETRWPIWSGFGCE